MSAGRSGCAGRRTHSEESIDMTGAGKKCFVISPIDEPGSPIRKHADMTLHAVIRPALAECDLNLSASRGDESAEIGLITNHVILDIENSDLIVADLSFLNPNVFYELGFAHAAEKPVIHLAHKSTKLPFDNAGYRTIVFDPTDWHSQEAARKQILEQARSVLVSGAKVSNPITQARGWGKLRNSADSEEKLVSRLLEEVSQLKMTVRTLAEESKIAELGRSKQSSLGSAKALSTDDPLASLEEEMRRLLGKKAG
jgi:hypothetical protein